MKETTAVIAGAGIGASLMYALDPERGRRRRTLARDQVVRVLSKSDDAIGATARDMANRTRGVVAEARAFLAGEKEVPDETLAQRVRAQLGHYISHPRSVEVDAAQGRVTLRGVILARELDDLLRAVRRVRGVREVDNQLEVHEQPGDVPGLQGGIGRTGRRFELLQSTWSPTARVLVGVAGTALAASAATRRDPLGLALCGLGLGMLARAVTNLEARRLVGVRSGRRAVDLQKNLNVNAPVETVFEFWRDYQNFPRFMANVREVRDLGGGRSRWTVAGPAGSSVEWEAEITRLEPNELLAWKTLPGSTVEHAGIIRFERTPEGSTRLDIRMSYNPPAGALGHGVARLFGADPKSEMDADLMRMKTLIETGRAVREAPGRRGEGSEELVH